MLKNDEVFWEPTEQDNAPYLSWGNSGGDFDILWEHTVTRWNWILQVLAGAGLPRPGGAILEFGPGMGLVDDLIKDEDATFTLLDHTDAYITERPHPLSSRCRHVIWNDENLEQLQSEGRQYDWVMSIAVFYHLDDITVVSLIRQLGAMLRPGGHVLIEGFIPATVEMLDAEADRRRLFRQYPTYLLNAELIAGALASEFDEVFRGEILVYRRR